MRRLMSRLVVSQALVVASALVLTGCEVLPNWYESGIDTATPDVVDDVQLTDVIDDIRPVDVPVDVQADLQPTDLVLDVTVDPLIPVEDGDKLTVSNGTVTLVYDLAKGTFDLGAVPGQNGLIKARSEAILKVGGVEKVMASATPAARVQYLVENTVDALGDAVVISFDAVAADNSGSLKTVITFHYASPAVTFKTFVTMPDPQGAVVKEIRPFAVDFAYRGTLHLGPGTKRAIVVDNGSELLLDFAADARMVGENSGGVVGKGFASNWSAAVCTAAKSCAVAGFVTTNIAIGVVTTDRIPGESVIINGDDGLTTFSVRNLFRPTVALVAGVSLASDLAYLDLTDNSHEGLLRLGRAIAAFNDRQPPAVPPSSWNSWAGGGGSGGAGQGIDETFILQNLDAATRDFLPYGMDYFLIDDGWQIDDGLWMTDETKFPKHGEQDGMAWIAEQIFAAGFLPGIWAAPFRVGKDWPVAIDHPDWLLKLDDFGTIALGSTSGYAMLDPSNEEVREYLRGIYSRITKDWGYRFLKLDFSVYSMFGTNYVVAGKTGLALYKEALQVIREVIGPDVVLMIVSGTGVNYGVADAARLTLDNMPRWGVSASMFDQGIRTTVLSASHRYWMGNTVWSNNPDLLFFRDTQGLTANEAHTFALFASVYSGIVKLGESFTDLAALPEALALVERMVPPIAAFPEPMDLFQKRYPELWRVPMAATGANYDVYGLFHWGENRDMPAQKDMDESERMLTIPAEVTPRVYFDLESGVALTDVEGNAIRQGDVEVLMSARSGRIVMARAVSALGSSGPVFLATDRHLMGGAGVLAEQVDGDKGTKVVFTKAVPGRVTKVSFLVAKDAVVDVQTTDATDVMKVIMPYADADLLTIRLTPTTTITTITASYPTM